MSKIYDNSLSFNLVRRYTIFTFKRFYSEFIVIGKENIPKSGPVIFAPNHTNALMDALAIYSVAPKNIPVIFLARSDIFKNKVAAKILYFTKIMPAFRMRDGIENLGKNNPIFNQCVEVLDQRKALGIMPEGNQEIERKLRPLVKGIFRIAFAAQKKYGNKNGIKIIPIGLDYGDLIKSNKHIIINVGKPIEISEYMNAYEENPVNATNDIRDRLRVNLDNLSLNLDTDKYYTCFETVIEVANKSELDELKLRDTTINRFVARQKIAHKLVEFEKMHLEKTEKLDSLCTKYTNLLISLNLKSWVFDSKFYTKSTLLFKGLFIFFTFPVFIYGFILNITPFIAPVFLRKYILKINDIGFFSTLHYGIGILVFPFFYIFQTVIFSHFSNMDWWVVIFFFLTQYPFGKWAIKWYSMKKKYSAQLRFLNLKQKKSHELLQVETIRRQIINLIS